MRHGKLGVKGEDIISATGPKPIADLTSSNFETLLCVCVCERERERERQSLRRRKVSKVDIFWGTMIPQHGRNGAKPKRNKEKKPTCNYLEFSRAKVADEKVHFSS
jgi:hypothetical protein